MCPALSSFQKDKHMIQNSNFLDHPYTLKKGTHIATFSILTTEKKTHSTSQPYLNKTPFEEQS